MFEMTVEETIVHNKLSSFAGPCNDSAAFKSPLFDEDGNKYDVYPPMFIKRVVPDDGKQIMLIIDDFPDVHKLKGKRLFTH
jgi:hypothetical protein